MSTKKRARRMMMAMVAAGVSAAAVASVSIARAADDTDPATDGDPITYTDQQRPSSAGGDAEEVAQRVRNGLGNGSLVTDIAADQGPNGLAVKVSLKHNDDEVEEVWNADLALGAVAELARSEDARILFEAVSEASATGPSSDGKSTTTMLAVGAVQLGQSFASPDDEELTRRITEAASQYGLKVSELTILHPLDSAVRVVLTIPDETNPDWTIDELRAALVGKTPVVEGILIELNSPAGGSLLRSGVAYRTGSGGLSFARGQDDRFGAAHGGLPAE